MKCCSFTFDKHYLPKIPESVKRYRGSRVNFIVQNAATSYNCVDLFAGAGGFSLAAQLSGMTVKLAVENDKHAASTYRNNIFKNQKNPPVLIEGDITSLCPHQTYADRFQDNEQCHLLLGGPPCQGFSTHRIKNSGVADVRNQLILTYFEFVRAFKPTMFLMENVPGILWDRHKPYLEKFYSEGERSGYTVLPPVILDARDYGLPQRRKRVFVLGLINSARIQSPKWPPSKTHGSTVEVKKNSNLKPWVNCSSIFSKPLPRDGNDIHMNHGNELIEAFKKTPPNGGSRKDSGRVLACHKNHDGHKDVYGRIDPSQPAPTMTTACINPSKGRFVHPTLHHGITVRHAARIQTFPDSFRFEGGLTASGKQIGNAVPIDMGQILIDHLKLLLEVNKVEYASAA